MSYFDIIKVFEDDRPMLKHKTCDLAKKYYHQLKVNKQQRIMCSEVNGNRGLNYFVIFCNDSLDDFRKNNPAYTTIAYYYSSKGLVAIDSRIEVAKEILSGQQFSHKSYSIYEAHFFDRYRERILKNQQMQKLDVMKQFFKSHIMYMAEPQNDERYPDGIYVPINEGMGIGYRLRKDIVVMKTCVSNEQMHNEQKDIHTICEEIMKNTKIDSTMCITRL
ncbi:MAG: hypothetical protein K6G73_07410 [Marinilabiliaceae bacterium]|nr:hypothetical protein [Marinilabiliaceae bacterium]